MRSRVIVLLLIAAAARAQGAGTWPDSVRRPEAHALFLPDAGWALALDARGFTVRSAVATAREARVVMEDGAGFVVSAVLEPAPDADGAAACRALFAARTPRTVTTTDERLGEDPHAAYREWTVPQFAGRTEGARINQRNLAAYLDHGSVCAEVHVAKAVGSPADRARQDALARGARIVAPFEPGAADWLAPAKHMLRDRECAPETRHALDAIVRLESGGHALDRTTWRSIVESAARCATSTARLQHALDVLDAALLEDPGHSPFHWGRAAALAGRADVPGTLAAIERARATETGLTPLPDPWTFPGFALVRDEPAFQSGLARLWSLPEADREERLPVGQWDPLESTCRHASLSIL